MEDEIIRQKLEAGRKLAADLASRANRLNVEKMIDAFQQNSRGACIVDVINDPDGFLFVEVVLKATAGGKAIEMSGDIPPGISHHNSAMYFMGFLVGTYLTELGKAKLILRQG